MTMSERRLNELVVKEIMVPLEEYPCLPDTHTLRQAIDAMSQAQIMRQQQASLPRVALVFDEGMTDLQGMLRRRDIMRGLEPRFLSRGSLPHQRKHFPVEIDPNLSELSYEKLIARMRERAERLVREFTIPITATIRHDDHLMKAIYEMVDQNTSLLPVLQEDEVVGVVRSVDVLHAIQQLIHS